MKTEVYLYPRDPFHQNLPTSEQTIIPYPYPIILTNPPGQLTPIFKKPTYLQCTAMWRRTNNIKPPAYKLCPSSWANQESNKIQYLIHYAITYMNVFFNLQHAKYLYVRLSYYTYTGYGEINIILFIILFKRPVHTHSHLPPQVSAITLKRTIYNYFTTILSC